MLELKFTLTHGQHGLDQADGGYHQQQTRRPDDRVGKARASGTRLVQVNANSRTTFRAGMGAGIIYQLYLLGSWDRWIGVASG